MSIPARRKQNLRIGADGTRKQTGLSEWDSVPAVRVAEVLVQMLVLIVLPVPMRASGLFVRRTEIGVTDGG